MTKKKQVGVRFDSNRTRLKTGETQRPNGTYAYRWSTPDGKRHSIYAPTLEKLREQKEQEETHRAVKRWLFQLLKLLNSKQEKL